ncbi:hypothetical protein [Variovorax paradoxus]|uniref:hypothetical protein n=1 Tax=Variovorax paradoxus TaxID=34073 RepID=UPI001932B8D7|nr:hypothetical protein INQ48_18145 [Variovorax paradoxus]
MHDAALLGIAAALADAVVEHEPDNHGQDHEASQEEERIHSSALRPIEAAAQQLRQAPQHGGNDDCGRAGAGMGDAGHGLRPLCGGLGGGLRGRSTGGLQHLGRQVPSSEGCENPVLDASWKLVGPLRDGSRRDADCFSGGSDRPTEQFKSASFVHSAHVSALMFFVKARLSRRGF